MIIIIGNPSTGSDNIKSGQRDGIWNRKMCHANNENRKTISVGRNGTTKSRKNLNVGGKGILQSVMMEADTIKHAGWKKKLKKNNTSGKRENYLKPNYIAEISSKR